MWVIFITPWAIPPLHAMFHLPCWCGHMSTRSLTSLLSLPVMVSLYHQGKILDWVVVPYCSRMVSLQLFQVVGWCWGHYISTVMTVGSLVALFSWSVFFGGLGLSEVYHSPPFVLTYAKSKSKPDNSKPKSLMSTTPM